MQSFEEHLIMLSKCIHLIKMAHTLQKFLMSIYIYTLNTALHEQRAEERSEIANN